MRAFSQVRQLFLRSLKTALQTKDLLPLLPEYIRFQLLGHGDAWRIFTHLTAQERLILYRLAREQLSKSDGNILCEIGSYLGASSCFLAAAAKEAKEKSAILYCVDTWENQGMTEGIRDTFDEFKKNIKSFSDVIITHVGDSTNIAKSFDDKIDLLFIDGDHSYEGCRRDVENWIPHLNTGGLIAMHDYGWANGVREVVTEMVLPQAKKFQSLPNMCWAWI